jgi:hypothetical protein
VDTFSEKGEFKIVILLARLLIFTSLTLSPMGWNRHAQEEQAPSGCRLLEQALADYAQVKPGSSRGELERYFSRDGGLQTPGSTRYVYPRCEYLHVDLEFELAEPEHIAFSAEDKVTRISRLYVEYPAKD